MGQYCFGISLGQSISVLGGGFERVVKGYKITSLLLHPVLQLGQFSIFLPLQAAQFAAKADGQLKTEALIKKHQRRK